MWHRMWREQRIIDGMTQEAGNRSVAQLAKEDNEMPLAPLKLRSWDRSEVPRAGGTASLRFGVLALVAVVAAQT
jgi:hypothetical protein